MVWVVELGRNTYVYIRIYVLYTHTHTHTHTHTQTGRHPKHPASRLSGLLGLFCSLIGQFIGLFWHASRLPGRQGATPTHPASRLSGLLGLFCSLIGQFIGLFDMHPAYPVARAPPQRIQRLLNAKGRLKLNRQAHQKLRSHCPPEIKPARIIHIIHII